MRRIHQRNFPNIGLQAVRNVVTYLWTLFSFALGYSCWVLSGGS